MKPRFLLFVLLAGLAGFAQAASGDWVFPAKKHYAECTTGCDHLFVTQRGQCYDICSTREYKEVIAIATRLNGVPPRPIEVRHMLTSSPAGSVKHLVISSTF